MGRAGRKRESRWVSGRAWRGALLLAGLGIASVAPAQQAGRDEVAAAVRPAQHGIPAAVAAADIPAGALGQLARVKDVATIEGIRDNQLVGYGLVVGLHGTGDRDRKSVV